jgi:hypothetical protein
MALALVVLGIGLRAWQFFGASSLWRDEAAVAGGVLPRPLWTLLSSPLPYGQVAPVGFLLIEKIAVAVFGAGELPFRLWSFAASILALTLFWRVAVASLPPAAAVASVALFASAKPLVWHAAQAKQYAGDVLVTVALLWMAVSLASTDTPRTRILVWSAVVGALAVWVSQPAVFVLFAIAAWLVFHTWRVRWTANRRVLFAVAIILALWAASAALSTLLATMRVESDLYVRMRVFWRHGFPPSSSVVDQATWFADRLVALFGPGTAGVGSVSHFAYGPGAPVAVALVGVGLAIWIVRRHQFGALSLLAVGATIAAAAAHRYPFDDRLILFLVPLFVLAIGEAVGVAATRWKGRPAAIAIAAATVVAAVAGPYAAEGLPVFHVDHVKPALAYFESRRQPGDEVYLPAFNSLTIGFYAERYGLAANGYVVGDCFLTPDAWNRYFEEMRPFRGKRRVWLITTRGGPELRDALTEYLNAAGRRIGGYQYQFRAADHGLPLISQALLYDLSDTARFDAARSDYLNRHPRAIWAPSPRDLPRLCPSARMAPGRYGNAP